MKSKGPKVLFVDVETAPIIAHVWDLWDQNIGLNQIVKDWHLLSWSAKWLDSKKIMYMDQRNAKKIEDDKQILAGIWKLIDEADIIVTQNGKKFDQKKLNARFVLNGFQPPSSVKHIDTLQIAKKHFAFTSNKLAYMSAKLNKKYKKLEHKKYPGHEMWVECLAGNLDAWKHMEKYNKYDVLALEELYKTLSPWDNSVNFGVFNDSLHNSCKCGSNDFKRIGFAFTNAGKYQRYRCRKCGAESRSKVNELSKEKRKSLRV